MSMVRKIENISKVSMPVQIDEQTVVYIQPGEKMENTQVLNLDNIKPYTKVELDLSEVKPVNERKKTKLYD